MFRLDINALRFIAVASVVLFHFQINFLPGGYAGVDVFFVISGYLMNEIISRQPVTLSSSIGFYKKRFKRIYPALLAAVTLYAIILLIISPPNSFKDSFKEIVPALTFTSNIFYLKTASGYFSNAADFYFLLHTWSLGVEFQFYLCLPIFLFIVQKLRVKKVLAYALITAASLVLCILIAKSHPQANFYLLPTRAWELFLGAMASSIKWENKYKKTTEIVCLVLIVGFVLTYKETAFWPSYPTLIPAIATALILHAGVKNEQVLLKNHYIQKIGKWSYSIYLVHWPIVSLFYTNNIAFSLANQLIGIAVSIFLGYLSYELVEQKVRFSWLKTPTAAICIVALFFGLSSASVSSQWLSKDVVSLDKYSNYITTDAGKTQFGQLPALCFIEGSNLDFNYKACVPDNQKGKTILLLGDSHAAEFSAALKQEYKNDTVLQVTAAGCPAIIDSVGSAPCVNLMNYAFNKLIPSRKIDAIIVASDWYNFHTYNDINKGIEKTQLYLQKFTPNVYFITQTKHFKPTVYRLLQIHGKTADINSLRERDTEETYNDMRTLSSIDHIKFFDLYNYGCQGKQCVFVKDNTVPMFFDDNHYNYEWTREIVHDVIAKNI
ncbi:acyltransferase family protein [Rouxiella badensis]|uniref:acyltransferase family protein n=1 Tax=Rouxiella badensis TaxID=1646377 RepID=UPI000367E35B